MKYFLDQEFIEGFRKAIPWLPTIGRFNRKKHFIDLVSIGLVGEDGSEFYAICNEFNPNEASDWVKENVLFPIMGELYMDNYKAVDGNWDLSKPQYWMFKKYGRSRKNIMVDLLLFIYRDTYSDWDGSVIEFIDRARRFGWNTDTPTEFYGYYADYDWVLFCSLFGTMMDLPELFPKYCKDLQQMKDDYIYLKPALDNPDSIRKKVSLKEHPRYPVHLNEHNALADAHWNRKLFYFLRSLN